MALAESVAPTIPYDSFGVRIAIVRASKGWNITQAGAACGIKPENWRLWEKTGRHPQDYEDVCRRIADGSGYERAWIAVGGPLTKPCLTLLSGDQHECLGQQTLHLPVLVSV